MKICQKCKNTDRVLKETNSERTIKDHCERSYGNIGKIISLRALFRFLSVNSKKKIPAQCVKNYGRKELKQWQSEDF